MPTYYRPPNVSSFLGDSGGGGSSVADIILNGGQRQAQLLLEAGRQRAAAFEGIGSDLAGGLAAFGQARADKKVMDATRAAAAPGADINSILSGLPPELQGRAMKGISDWNEFNSKRQESDLRIKKLQDDIAGAQKERQQHDFDTVAVGAFHAKDWLDQADGGLGALTLLSQQAKSAGIPGAEHYDEFISGAQDAWKAAQGDPKAMQTVADAVRQQATPLLQQMMSAGSASVQEKFAPKTREVTITNADGSTTSKIVEDKPGQEFASARKPETPGSEADFIRRQYGPNPTPAQILAGREKYGAAGREPDVAMSLSPAALKQAAQLFLDTGQMPPAGMGKQGTAMRQAILNEAAKMSPDANIAENKATFQADSGSLKKLQAQTDAVAAFESTASKNSKLLDDILKKTPDLGAKFLNLPARFLSNQLGSEDVAAFNTIRQSVQNEYARIISNPGLSGTMSDSARKEAETLLSPNATVGQIRSALKVLQAEAKNRHSSYDEQLKAIKDRRTGRTPATSRYKVEVLP